MLLHNPGKPLTVSHWFMLELRSERTSEETLKRLGKAIRETFPGEEVEVFVPVVERDLGTFSLLTESYIFIRADDVAKIAKLRRVTGVLGVLAVGESLRPSKFIQVEDDYVQTLITTCLAQHLNRAATIRPGSWVRMLDGQCRGYCGTVLTISDGRVLVRVDKKTKIIHQETSIHNLLDMSYVPEPHRVFYYCPVVHDYLEESPGEAVAALGPDLHFDETEMKTFLAREEDTPTPTDGSTLRRHTGRGQTPTIFATSLLQGGEKRISEIFRLTADAIDQKAVISPKTATILWQVLREAVVHYHFPGGRGKKRQKHTYTEVEAIYGKLTPMTVKGRLPHLPLRAPKPVNPEVEDPEPAPMALTEVIRAALVEGHYDLMLLVEPLMHAIELGKVRSPKRVESLARAFRSQVMLHFKKIRPQAGIEQLVQEFGQGLRVAPSELHERFPTLEDLLKRFYIHK